jgi:hypothetical protein
MLVQDLVTAIRREIPGLGTKKLYHLLQEPLKNVVFIWAEIVYMNYLEHTKCSSGIEDRCLRLLILIIF